MLSKWKAWIKNWALKEICNTFVENEFLTVTKSTSVDGKAIHRVTFKGNILPEGENHVLRSEARSIRQMSAWNMIHQDMKSFATDKMVNKSTSIDDMVFSKAILYCLEMQEQKLKRLSDL